MPSSLFALTLSYFIYTNALTDKKMQKRNHMTVSYCTLVFCSLSHSQPLTLTSPVPLFSCSVLSHTLLHTNMQQL